MDNIPLDWYEEAHVANMTLDPDDIINEALANMRVFSLSGELNVSLADLKEFVQRCIRAREDYLVKLGVATEFALFYLWFDAQAGQLRFSTVSSCHGALPFGSDVITEADVESILSEFLSAFNRDGCIPWRELEIVERNDHDSAISDGAKMAWATRVWSLRIPRNN